MANFDGTPGDDYLIGTNADDTINGFGGNDVAVGEEGNDTIDGGDDHDLLNGQQGDDSIYGGSGDDLIRPGTGSDYVDGGAGNDRVSYASVGTDLVTGVTVSLGLQGTWQDTGGGGVDYLVGFEHLTGTRYDDTLSGDDNDNWLWGGFDPSTGIAGDDTISGGGGNDLIQIGLGNATVDGGTGSDTLTFLGDDIGVPTGVTFNLSLQGTLQATSFGNVYATNFENLSGTIFADNLGGDGNANVLAGDRGNDYLVGGAGDDTLYGDGQVNVDTHDLGYSGPIVTVADVATSDPAATDGNDVLEGGVGDDGIYGGGGIDTASYAHASGSVEVFLSNSGNGGSDGADGFDNLFSIENITGSAYDDILSGNNSDNVLDGGAGNDLIYARGGNDTMIGGAGDDFLRGYDGNDIFDGGSGIDRASFYLPVPPATGVHVDLNIQGVAQDTGEGMDTLIGIENVSGTIYDDTLIGDGGDNWIWDGSDGDATVASSGNDTISAGAGNDLVEVGNGNDTLDGGAGIDTWSLLGGQSEISSAGVTVSLALQGTTQDTEQGMMLVTGFENISGSIYDDNITGDTGANVLLGDLGTDTLNGGDGNDTLYGDGRIWVDTHDIGGSGPIALTGDLFAGARSTDPSVRPGNDVLNGGRGDDFIYGGGGDDVMTGGQGHDDFVIEWLSDRDTITDFSNQDTIVFNVPGVDDFGDLTFLKVGNDTLVTWGTSDSLLLQGIKPNQLSASDFSFGGASAAALLPHHDSSPHAADHFFI
jgi:Ca2+-binding RTX toxin-like protein